MKFCLIENSEAPVFNLWGVHQSYFQYWSSAPCSSIKLRKQRCPWKNPAANSRYYFMFCLIFQKHSNVITVWCHHTMVTPLLPILRLRRLTAHHRRSGTVPLAARPGDHPTLLQGAMFAQPLPERWYVRAGEDRLRLPARMDGTVLSS